MYIYIYVSFKAVTKRKQLRIRNKMSLIRFNKTEPQPWASEPKKVPKWEPKTKSEPTTPKLRHSPGKPEPQPGTWEPKKIPKWEAKTKREQKTPKLKHAPKKPESQTGAWDPKKVPRWEPQLKEPAWEPKTKTVWEPKTEPTLETELTKPAWEHRKYQKGDQKQELKNGSKKRNQSGSLNQ